MLGTPISLNRVSLAVFVALGALLAASVGCKSRTSAKGLDAIRDRGELRVAMSGQYPPFNYFNEKNQLVGFDVDIANEVASRLDLPAKLITLRWDGIVAGLTAGRYDLIIGSMAITPQRQKAIDFSNPYYESGAQVFARPSTPLAKTGDLDGTTLGVNLGTTYEEALRKREEIEEIRTYGGVPELVLDLKAKRIDGFVTDRLVGFHAQSKRGGSDAPEFVPAGEPLYEEQMGIALEKNQPKLLAAVNGALAAMKEDGTYKEISVRWFGRDVGNAAEEAPESASRGG